MPSRTIKVWLPESALRAMRKEASRRLPMESGGLLLGYWAENSTEVVVTNATEPGPRAVHRRHEFIPDDDYQDGRIDAIYEASGRRHRYIGDWHTHPLGASALSYKDRRTLHRIATTKAAQTPMPLMAVLSGGSQEWDVTMWRYERLANVLDRIALRCCRRCELAIFTG